MDILLDLKVGYSLLDRLAAFHALKSEVRFQADLKREENLFISRYPLLR